MRKMTLYLAFVWLCGLLGCSGGGSGGGGGGGMPPSIPPPPPAVRQEFGVLAQNASPLSIVGGEIGLRTLTVLVDVTQLPHDLRFHAIPLRISAADGGRLTDLTNGRAFTASTPLNTGSNVVNPIHERELLITDNAVTIANGTVATFTIHFDVSAAAPAGATYQVAIDTENLVTFGGEDVVTHDDVYARVSGNLAGPLITVVTSGLTINTDSSSPAERIVLGAFTNVTVSVAQVRASPEPVRLEGAELELTGGFPGQTVGVGIYRGNTLLGSAFFVGTNRISRSTFTTGFTLDPNVDEQLRVAVELSPIGPNFPVQQSNLPLRVDLVGLTATGLHSGRTIVSSGRTQSAGVRVFKAAPIVSVDSQSVPQSGVLFDRILLRFTITPVGGQIGLNKQTFRITGENAVVNGLFVVGPNGSTTRGFASISTSGIATVWHEDTNGNREPLQVGQATTFELRASSIQPTGTGPVSITAQMLGDAAPSPTTGTTSAGNVQGNFVWSPNTLSQPSTTNTSDHVNGWGVQGLPTNSHTRF